MSRRHQNTGKRRKVEFKLYPSKAQERQLHEWLELHRVLYNRALAERRDAYDREGRSVNYYEQQNALPAMKAEHPEYKALGAHALQETLRRLDRAFAAFFRRVKAGKSPGYPRFKGKGRLKSFTYPDASGWSLYASGSGRSHRLRISGLGEVRLRGKHRFPSDSYTANDLTIFRRGNRFYASVTLRVSDEGCRRKRSSEGERGFDLGLQNLLTFDDGEVVENPRFVRSELDHLRSLQRERSRKVRGSLRYRRLSQKIARTHERIERKRRDFLHKLSTRLVRQNALLATEELSVKNMSASGGAHKRGLNREMLSAGWSTLLAMIECKAEEAGTRLHVANTRELKPTQRCWRCWRVRKKHLCEREHVCSCGVRLPRDQNSARVCLVDAREKAYAEEPGTGSAVRGDPLEERNSSFKDFPDDPRNRDLSTLKASFQR